MLATPRRATVAAGRSTASKLPHRLDIGIPPPPPSAWTGSGGTTSVLLRELITWGALTGWFCCCSGFISGGEDRARLSL
ncbi:MAG: hypothetical protein H6569_14280 [Lewinellaceae bacterium]|nr:hypothetical protein [Lewinellaceae bacterium]